MNTAAILDVQHRDDAVLARVTCQNFTTEATDGLRADFNTLLSEQGSLPVVVDLAQVRFMPSVTIGAMVEANNRCQEQGRQLALVAVPDAIKKVFELCALDQMFSMYASVEDALAGS